MKQFLWTFLLLLAPSVCGWSQQLAPPVDIKAAEYFWDTDPGFGLGRPITVTGQLGEASISDLSVDFSGLQPGFHAFYLRFQDSNNQWGIPVKLIYFLRAEEEVPVITRAEYFLDTRVNEGEGTAISGTLVNVEDASFDNVTLNTDAFDKGFRKLYLRFGDASGWGIPSRLDFFNPEQRQPAPITRAEYFLDALGQPGTGTVVETPVSDENVQYADVGVPLGNTPGFRRLFFRVGDENSWGIPVASAFFQPEVRDTVNVSAAEYFFDTDPGLGAGNNLDVTEGATVSLNSGIPLERINPGFRRFFVRFKDKENQWGPAVRVPLFVPEVRSAQSGITAMEFFYSGGRAPTPGSSAALEPLDGTFNGLEENGVVLTRITQAAGNHAVYARARDASGQWGIPSVQPFEVTDQRVIEGQIYVPAGQDSVPAPDRIVQLFQNGNVLATDTTEFKGFFSFGNLASGTYEVQAKGVIDPVTGIESVSPRRQYVLPATASSVITSTGTVRTPAAVVAVSEGRFATRRDLNSPFEIRFSDALVPGTVTNRVVLHSSLQGSIPVSISLANGDSVIRVTPSLPLSVGAEVKITTLAGIKTVTGSDALPFSSRGWAKVNRGVNEFSTFRDIDSDPSNTNPFTVTDIAVGDLDADFDVDVASMHRYQRGSEFTDSLVIRFNAGDGTYNRRTAARLYTTEGIQLNHSVTGQRMELLDWDKDGDLDILIVATLGLPTQVTSFSIYQNNGTGTFSRSAGVSLATYSDYASGDVNHDGFPDIVFSTSDNRLIGIQNNGSGGFAEPGQIHSAANTYNNARLALADFSNDGLLDLVVNNTNARTIAVYRGNGSMFTAAQIQVDSALTYASNIFNYDIEALDWNNDGYMDLYGFDDQNFTEWRNNRRYTGLTPTSATRFGLSANGNYTEKGSHAIGDIDNDGILDIVHTIDGSTQTYLAALRNTTELFGHGGATLIQDAKANGSLHYPRLADVDGDGDLDIFVARRLSGFKGMVRVYINAAVSTNRAPVVAGGSTLPAEKEIFIGTPLIRDISADFSDPDGDQMIYTATSSDAQIATASISGSVLTVTGLSAGPADISVSANDRNGGITTARFRAYFSPAGNRVPRLVKSLPDTSAKATTSPFVMSLAGYFSDPESAALSYTASVSGNNTMAASIVNTSQLRITFSDIGSGLITVRASDGTSFVEDQLTFTVIENINRTPQRIRNFRDTTIAPNLVAPYDIPLAGFFTDEDGDALTYSVSTNNANIATGQIVISANTVARITPTATVGTATMTITATDPRGASANGTFTVSKQNRAPVLVKLFRDTTVAPSSAPFEILLSEYFSDPDGETLSFSASSANTAVASVSITAVPRRLRVVPGSSVSSSNITVVATDPSGLNANDTFVLSLRGAPQTLTTLTSVYAISNQTTAVSYSMSTLFSDASASVNLLETEFTSTAPNVAYFQRWTSTTIVLTTVSEGTAVLTMKARRTSDQQESATLTLNVTVAASGFQSISTASENSYYKDGIPAKTWTLISVPATLDNNASATVLFDELKGKDPFKLYRLATDGNYTEVTGSELESAFQHVYGGYWFKTLAKKSPFEVTTQPGLRSNTRTYNGYYNIGWRFIAVPFDAPVTWSPAGNSVNLASPRLWQFNEDSQEWIQLQQTDKLKPWGAYLYHTTRNIGILMSLESGIQSAAKAVAEPDPVPSWQVNLSINNTGLSFGEAPDAESGWDVYDYPLLPQPPDSKEPRVYFGAEQGPVTADFRPVSATAEEGVKKARKLFLPAGRHELRFEGADADQNTAVLVHGNGLYALLQTGESKTVTVKESGFVMVHAGESALLERSVLPTEPNLFDAFPNPFNPQTTIRFAVPERSAVTLDIFDLTGRKVQTLVQETFESGYHTVRFDGAGISSGVYLYRLAVNGKAVATRKMTLLK